jgi:Domain of unknown function (DUF4395)
MGGILHNVNWFCCKVFERSQLPYQELSMPIRLPAFPNPVNELTARVVAAGVVLLAVAALALAQPWLSLVLAAGFLLRVLYGPRFSPLAVLANRVIVPRLPWGRRMVAGPPKRFAQTIGLTFSTAAALLFYAFSADMAGYAVLAALIVAAVLESAFGLCLGCRAFALLMRAGVIPAEICESCNDIWAGRERPTTAVSAPTAP